MSSAEQTNKEIANSKIAMFDNESLECGNCGSDVMDANINESIKYCPYCGQKLKEDK